MHGSVQHAGAVLTIVYSPNAGSCAGIEHPSHRPVGACRADEELAVEDHQEECVLEAEATCLSEDEPLGECDRLTETLVFALRAAVGERLVT